MTKEEEVIFRQEFETEWTFLNLKKELNYYENDIVQEMWRNFIKMKEKKPTHAKSLFVAHMIISRQIRTIRKLRSENMEKNQ